MYSMLEAIISSIGATWNLTWPLTSLDLGGHPPRYAFCTCPRSSIIPSPCMNSIQATWNMTWPHLTSESIFLDTHFALVLSLASPYVNLSSMWTTWIWPNLSSLMTFWNNRLFPLTTMPSFILIGCKGLNT